MKKLFIAAILSTVAASATAGSYAPPVVEPSIIIEDTAGSGSQQWLVPVTFIFILFLTMRDPGMYY